MQKSVKKKKEEKAQSFHVHESVFLYFSSVRSTCNEIDVLTTPAWTSDIKLQRLPSLGGNEECIKVNDSSETSREGRIMGFFES